MSFNVTTLSPPRAYPRVWRTVCPTLARTHLRRQEIYKVTISTIRAISITTLDIYNRGHQMPIQSLNTAEELNLQNKIKQVR